MPSLVPRLLPSFLSHTVQYATKTGEEPDILPHTVQYANWGGAWELG